MNKFFSNLLGFSLRQRYFIFFVTITLAIIGTISFLKTPIEAFPDVTNTQIIIVTEWAGRSAEEVTRFVTIPIEVAMNGVQRKTNIRSTSMFGLSVIKIIFEDDVEDFFARQQVNNLLASVNLPNDAEPVVQPPYGPTGVIFRYTLKSAKKNSRDLLTIQNWVIDRQLRSVPGVADIVSFGGEEKIYEISVNPNQLSKYNITPLEVYQAVNRCNINVGGDIIEKNGQAYVVRGIGLLESISDIENIVIDNIQGTPIFVKNVAVVSESAAPRVGQAGRNYEDDVVQGIVVMRKGENPSNVLEKVKAKIKHLNEEVLPSDVKMVTFYDRDNLMSFCTKTVLTNLTEGIILVTVIVFLFMADWRTTVTVGVIIPLSLLFAFMCMRLKGMSANLLSLGAVDFGIIIDGAVVMVEGLFVLLDHKAQKLGMERFNKLAKLSIIKKEGAKLAKAIFFSKLIIITALLPIFAFEKVEGKMFSPLAYTLGFALLGALIFTLTLVPVLISILLKKNVKEKHNPLVEILQKTTMKAFNFTFKYQKLSVIISLIILASSLYSFNHLGSEFLPQLNEGALWVEAKLPMSSSLNETLIMVKRLRRDLLEFEEVEEVLSQIGRSNDGTDPSGFYYVQCQVNLKPKKEWKTKISSEELIKKMDVKLNQYPGIIYNFSQPIIDAVAEAVAGINASLAVKIFGKDLQELDQKANEVAKILEKIQGVKDLGIVRNLGQPEFSIVLDETKMARYGVATADAQAVIEMAIGGKAATQLFEQERKFDVRVRYQKQYRTNETDIGNLKVPNLHGKKVQLKEIADIRFITGPAFIYRDNHERFIAIKFSVRERDMGSTINEAQKLVGQNVKLNKGYRIEWVGEFENQVRATKRLSQVVPISIFLIFLILFITFGSMLDAGLVLINVPFALIGGIFALHLTGTVFSISAGIGFIALFGICIQNGVILVTVFKQNLSNKLNLSESLIEGVKTRIRPVVMTALMAAIGLLPAALSTGIGSETQKPLAIVVIGGLVSATILTLLVFPIIVGWAYQRKIKRLKKRQYLAENTINAV